MVLYDKYLKSNMYFECQINFLFVDLLLFPMSLGFLI